MNLKLRFQCALLMLVIAGSARCDLVPSLVPIVPPATLGSGVVSVDWCRCEFLAAGGLIGSFQNPIAGIIGTYQFDQTTGNLSLIGTPTTLGLTVFSVAWCPSCKFLAAGGRTSDLHGIINIYSFNPLNPGSLDTIVGSTITPGDTGAVLSIDWCPSCTVFAASFDILSPGVSHEIQAYSFDPDNPGNPGPIGDPAKSDARVLSIKWCGDCQYLAAVDTNGNLTIYTLDAIIGLELATSVTSDANYLTVDWCMSCSYIAAGGANNSGAIVDIYNFDPQRTEPLLLITSTVVSSTPGVVVSSLGWCQDCNNLAVVAENSLTGSNAMLFLYHFDPTTTPSLILVQSQPLNFNLSPGGKNIDWCDNCCELAVGGFLGTLATSTGIIELFRSSACGLPAPTNLRAQKICHRFPTQVDIVNKICWDAVTGAVAYNVYADAALKVLLATIPSPTVCYAQYQICNRKSVTYYVTAVDANGTQSAPAAVTI